jgi:hypothetical protein
MHSLHKDDRRNNQLGNIQHATQLTIKCKENSKQHLSLSLREKIAFFQPQHLLLPQHLVVVDNSDSQESTQAGPKPQVLLEQLCSFCMLQINL